MSVDNVLDSVIAYVSDPVFFEHMKRIFIVCVGCFVIAGLLRLISGKNGSAVKSIAAVMGILILYCLRVALARVDSALVNYFVQLPFVQISSDSVQIFSLGETSQAAVYVELVNLILLVFLFHLFETLLPLGKNLFSWLFFRYISVGGAYGIYSAALLLFTGFLPNFIKTFAPIILLGLLILLLAVTVFKWLFGLILGITTSPVIGGIYTFFISNIVGKQLTKSAFTSAALFLLVYLCHRYSITVLTLNQPLGVILIPVVVLLLCIWFVINKVL